MPFGGKEEVMTQMLLLQAIRCVASWEARMLLALFSEYCMDLSRCPACTRGRRASTNVFLLGGHLVKQRDRHSSGIAWTSKELTSRTKFPAGERPSL